MPRPGQEYDEMEKRVGKYAIRSKIWIEDGAGRPVFGAGRCRILEAVDRLRSLQAAARELKMSYRAVWGRIRASEERLGKTLVAREGRGSRLTPYAVELMRAFQDIEARVKGEADAAFAALLGKKPR